VPVDGSHWLSMREVLGSLRDRGHEVVVVAPEVGFYIKPSESFVMKTYPVPLKYEEIEKEFKMYLQISFEEGPFLTRLLRAYEGLRKLGELSVLGCERLLKNRELIKYLEDSKF
ncbi:UD11 glucuronosyltransferase, partial [Campylorhamphus procurvoides]|nr:UD11 glucuronosyltransferase [Campylorhamphus procurvoides]